ncbi:MAG: TonB-dependent receptor [Bacteroidia bacterium]
MATKIFRLSIFPYFPISIFPYFLLLLSPALLQAQQKSTISGYVKDAKSGETLIGATVYLKENQKGSVTNVYGFYSFTVEQGSYNLVISYLGYVEQSQPVTLNKDLNINIDLQPKVIETQAAEVVGEKVGDNVRSTQMGKDIIEVETIKSIPAFMGEVDVLKAIQLLPGVLAAGDGNAGFYVRGGGPDQNLVQLDEATVYNASHLFGFFSVFNADAIKNVTLIKGGMPANYGNRLASVVDITMKDGNMKEFHGEGGLGFIASRFTVEGPIKKDTCSFIISARRTFIDLFLREPFVSKSSNAYGNTYYFYDLNTKINYKFTDKDRLFLSGYFGRDKFKFKSSSTGFKANIPWGNATATLRWNHVFNNKLFSNTSAIFTDYNFSFGAGQDEFEFKLYSGVRDWNGKIDFNYYPTVNHNVKFGLNYVYHTFTPSTASARQSDTEFDLGEPYKIYAHDAALYVLDEWSISDVFSVNGGLRYTHFAQVGPFDRYITNENYQVVDTVTYKSGEKVAAYNHIEPRLTATYIVGPYSSVKASFTQNYQYVHLASISSVSLPTDVWVPSSDRVKPQFGTQYAFGYFRNFKKDLYETSVEVYYKEMKNQIEYREGAQPDQDIKNNQDNNFVFGKGWSYGAEFFIKKKYGRMNGWIGYTLAWTLRNFPDLNDGKDFYAKYDRRHDLSIVFIYELSKKWSIGATFIYATGNALTLPEQRYLFAGPVDVSSISSDQFNNPQIYYTYGDRNSYRFKPYHRLDISATLKGKRTKKFESDWNFSIYNVYNRYNPYFIYFDSSYDTEKNAIKIQAKQVSLFPILPSVTWNFRF